MANTAMRTAAAADGTERTAIGKIKNFEFSSEQELREHLEELLEDQEGLCALTSLKLLMDGELGNDELRCSLDRIDSDGHYERGNLQVVCKFANRWKSDSDNAGFIRLIRLLQDEA